MKEADASALVEEVLQDTDLAKYFDEEFEVSRIGTYFIRNSSKPCGDVL